jgi:hypothetical protein
MRSLLQLTAAALIIGVCWSSAFTDDAKLTPSDRLKVAGTSISFVPHLPLSPAGGFAGFENVEHQVAVSALKVPAPPAPSGDA